MVVNIEDDDQELQNMKEVVDPVAHPSCLNEDDEDAYSDHENDQK